MTYFYSIFKKVFSFLLLLIGFSFMAMMATNTVVHAKDPVLISKEVNNITTDVSNISVIPNNITIDKVFVDKSERTLQLLSNNKIIKTYPIALGNNPIGHKQQQGDKRTPAGTYTLDYKNENSKFYRSIHISYPNVADKARAKALGISAGGDIMIHGQTNGLGHLAKTTQQRDWTDGCIAVTNEEMDEIMNAVKVGVAIEIIE